MLYYSVFEPFTALCVRSLTYNIVKQHKGNINQQKYIQLFKHLLFTLFSLKKEKFYFSIVYMSFSDYILLKTFLKDILFPIFVL